MKKNYIGIAVLVSIYLGVTVLFLGVITSLPKMINNYELEYIDTIQMKLFDVIQNESIEKLPNQMQVLRDEYNFEITIQHGDEKVYNSLPVMDGVTMRGRINENAVLYESTGVITTNLEEYDVWYAIYYPPTQQYVVEISRYLLIILFAIFLIMFILFVIFYVMLFKPLRVIKKKVTLLNTFHLDSISREQDDMINQQINEFADSLQDKISHIAKEHTDLEYALFYEREKLKQLVVFLRAFVHDLKTPLYNQVLFSDYSLETIENMTPEAREVIGKQREIADDTMNLVNNILKFVDDDVLEFMTKKNEFEMTTLFQDIFSIFTLAFQEKKLDVEIIADEDIEVESNRVIFQLIFQNILSNISKYASQGSSVNFELLSEEDSFTFMSYNESNPENIERMQETEHVLTAESRGNIRFDDASHEYSSGNGLYLVHELTKMLQGTYELVVEGETIKMIVVIPHVVK